MADIPRMYPGTDVQGQMYPNQSPVPSQNPSREAPYSPARQADQMQNANLRGEAQWGQGVVSAFVMTTFDARPIQGYDFVTYSGTNAAGPAFLDEWNVTANIHRLFYRVPSGKIAIVRDWNILAFPFSESGPVVTTDGTSGFFTRLDFFVNGIAQDQYAGRFISALPFGAVSGVSYIIAPENALIEMRITGVDATNTIDVNQEFLQSELSMHGNILLAHGLPPEWEPGTQGAVPMTQQGA